MTNLEKYAEEIKNYNGDNFCGDFIRPIILKENIAETLAALIAPCSKCFGLTKNTKKQK